MITNFNTPIEELDGHIYVSVDEVHKRDKEIERLNKIINEFDKFLFGELQIYGGGGIVQEHYDKLQELKDSDKE